MGSLRHEISPYSRYTIHPNPAVQTIAPNPKDLTDFIGRNACEIHEEIESLFLGYGADILYGQRYCAPCSSWRAERIQLGQELLPRFSYRVHIFREGKSDVCGRYLGYVSFRPNLGQRDYRFQYTTIAYLAPPTFMLRPRYHIITCVCGPPDGVLPFRGTPFCVPYLPAGWKAACLHAAIHQAVLLKMDAFGFTPISSQDMIAILWDILWEKGNQERSLSKLYEEGASLTHAWEILRRPEVRAGGVLETIDLGTHGSIESIFLETTRCMTDYLANGLPLIIEARTKSQQPEAHAILVFGMHLLNDPEDQPKVEYDDRKFLLAYNHLWQERRVDLDELPGRFVVHDLQKGPFKELCTLEMLIGSWMDDPDNTKSGISFLPIAPRGTNVGICKVRRAARRLAPWEMEDFWQNYKAAYPHLDAQNPHGPDAFRYVTRLLRTSQVKERYCHVEKGYSSELFNEAWNKLQGTGVNEENFWWSVEVRLPWRSQEWASSDREALPALVYLWSIEDTEFSPPRARICYLKRESGKDWVRLTTLKDDRGVDYVPFQHRA